MRRLPLACALVVLALVGPAAEALPLPPTRSTVEIEGPARVGTNAAYLVEVSVYNRGVPMSFANVSIYQNGVLVASRGSSFGHVDFTLHAPAQPGPITLVAKAYQGTALQGQSDPLTIDVFGPPAPPGGITLAADDRTSSVAITWTASPPTPDGIDRYVVLRQIGSGAWETAHRSATSIFAWEDAVPVWNDSVRYRVVARNTAGDSAPVEAIVALPPAPPHGLSDIGVPWIYACWPGGTGCDYVEPGSYMIADGEIELQPFVRGTARDANGWPIGRASFVTHVETRWSCDGCTSPTSIANSRWVTTQSNGQFNAIHVPIVWTDIKFGECRTVSFDGIGFGDTLTAYGGSRYTFCR